MGQALAQEDRDVEIFRRYCSGERQQTLAEVYGIDQSNVSRAIARAKALIPDTDRAMVLVQSTAMVDVLLEIFQPLAKDGDKGAARIVDRLIGRRADLLGLTNPRRLELYAAQQEIRHDPVDVRAELAALLDRIRERAA
jgi:hypothetical protein